MAEDSENLGLGQLLLRAARGQLAAMMHQLTARGFDGLTPTFSTVIPLLDSNGSRSAVLAQRAGVTKQAMSQLIKLLEERNYVEQVPDPTDTRAKVVRLTKRGVALRKACTEILRDLEIATIRQLGKRSLARLKGDLETVIKVLGEGGRQSADGNRADRGFQK